MDDLVAAGARPRSFFFKSSTYSLGHGHWLRPCTSSVVFIGSFHIHRKKDHPSIFPWMTLLSMDKVLSPMDGIFVCHFLSMDWRIASMDKSVICGKKMMDGLFIHECHPWIKSTDKDDG